MLINDLLKRIGDGDTESRRTLRIINHTCEFCLSKVIIRYKNLRRQNYLEKNNISYYEMLQVN